MDAIEPELVDRAEAALRSADGVADVSDLQLRWVGHRLQGGAMIGVEGGATLQDAEATVMRARAAVTAALPNVDRIDVRFGAAERQSKR